jgi:hypothetical protein
MTSRTRTRLYQCLTGKAHCAGGWAFAVHLHASSCRSVRPVYDFDLTFDFEAYRKRSLTVANIRSDMARFREWDKEIDKMRVQHSIGALYIDSKRLKSELQVCFVCVLVFLCTPCVTTCVRWCSPSRRKRWRT